MLNVYTDCHDSLLKIWFVLLAEVDALVSAEALLAGVVFRAEGSGIIVEVR